ncbi:uracil-DNA glycosylase family protein [Aestuariicella hydrocarbonica]|uniref:Uracil-DNA glycosylase family protein n=1 Tax=Pseudomaricurvus hydrocarbonicus TaxID=1470433 RepID=A0A9E5JPL0_9GAMM|nr:uracil-DNA glycosylase family protein [Aestuariicella hydrocarbonica]NHO64248.1 uracil-DNA glycosylase family protein [Aestuariicella hydrocarbonica]
MTHEKIPAADLTSLLQQVRQCRHCEAELPLGANPVVQIHPDARLLIIGQAPGTRVHASGIPWDDPSGDRLRQWLGLDKHRFYNPKQVAIMPMGFCYPGKGKSGDLPPRPECAPQWHDQLLAQMPNIELTLCIGLYAQRHYLPGPYKTLTERVGQWQHFIPKQLPLPHPSPRNRRWLQQHPWFESEVVPWLQDRVSQILDA